LKEYNEIMLGTRENEHSEREDVKIYNIKIEQKEHKDSG
jgi:hypothetical protein